MSALITSVENRRQQTLITFLSLLELGKMEFVFITQTENYQEIYIEPRRSIEANMLDRVEEYDSMRADEIAASMMQEAQKIDMNDDFILPDEKDTEEIAATEEINTDGVATDEEILAAESEMV